VNPPWQLNSFLEARVLNPEIFKPEKKSFWNAAVNMNYKTNVA
jgi:hypothetical protein